MCFGGWDSRTREREERKDGYVSFLGGRLWSSHPWVESTQKNFVPRPDPPPLPLSQVKPTAMLQEVEHASKTSPLVPGAVNALAKGTNSTEVPTARPRSRLSVERPIPPARLCVTTSRSKSAAISASVSSTPRLTITSASAPTGDSVTSAKTSTAPPAAVPVPVFSRQEISTSAPVRMRTQRRARVQPFNGTAAASREQPAPMEPPAGATTLASNSPRSSATPRVSSSSAPAPPPRHRSVDQTLPFTRVISHLSMTRVD